MDSQMVVIDPTPVVQVNFDFGGGRMLRLTYETDASGVKLLESWVDVSEMPASRDFMHHLPGWRVLAPASKIVPPNVYREALKSAEASIFSMIDQAKRDLGLSN